MNFRDEMNNIQEEAKQATYDAEKEEGGIHFGTI